MNKTAFNQDLINIYKEYQIKKKFLFEKIEILLKIEKIMVYEWNYSKTLLESFKFAINSFMKEEKFIHEQIIKIEKILGKDKISKISIKTPSPKSS